MNIAPFLFTMIGLLMLCSSLRPAYLICKLDESRGWQALLGLIVLFILSYSYFLCYFRQISSNHTTFLLISLVLLGGGLFVLYVTQLTLKSLQNCKQATEQEIYNSLHHSLTGLPNRTNLLQTLYRYSADEKPFALLLIDINNFKQINDALGHHYGDKLLTQMASRFSHAIPTNAFISHMWSDEFAIAVPLDNQYQNTYLDVVNAIHKTLIPYFKIMSYEVSCYVRIGISLFPDNTKSIDTLFQQADMAAYAAKDAHKAYVLYTQKLSEGINENFAIATKIKKAIENDDFALCYQPILDNNKHIHGAEVLIRWPQSKGSNIPPDRFIKVAEKSILIEKVTEWVIKKAFSDLKTLNKNGFTGTLHINLSSQDLQSGRLYDLLVPIIEESPSSHQQVIFEITESAMMVDLYAAKKTIQQLSEKGFKFSVDDFGTGFSSLSLLKELPIQQIKIDQSFVKNMMEEAANHAIVESTLFLAKNLEFSVVAEGVENCETVDELARLGCDYLQGYYFSRPLPLLEFIQYATMR